MLILAAAAEELGNLPGRTVGVGPVTAAAQAAALLTELKPDGVLLIGTCGIYPGRTHKIGTALMATRLGLSHGIAAMGLGYVPRAPKAIFCATPLIERAQLPTADVLTAGAITTDPTLASRLSDGWDAEHLEAFGVALACQQLGIPFNAILAIANEVGPNAHAQWLSHREEAQNAARQAARRLLG